MRKLLLGGVAIGALTASGAAMAADIPVKAPPMVAPVVLTWTGCYIGGEAGGAWGQSDHDQFTTSDSAHQGVRLHPRGAIVGGTLGCQIQMSKAPTGAGAWVFGFEGDLSWSTKDDGVDAFNFTAATVFKNTDEFTREHWLATERVRLGVTWGPQGSILSYVTGGAAQGGVRVGLNCIVGSAACFPSSFSSTGTMFGWTIGSGIEWAVNQNWSIKAEYLYVRFSDKNFILPEIDDFDSGEAHPPLIPTRITLDDNVLRFGVNYRWSWGKAPTPVVAKY